MTLPTDGARGISALRDAIRTDTPGDHRYPEPVCSHENVRIVSVLLNRYGQQRQGKPVVRGTRIPVALILEQFGYNLDLDDLFGAYPELTREDAKACLRYAQQVVERERPEAGVTGGATRASA
jgi:uncharacterized protein (DUF433 family)